VVQVKFHESAYLGPVLGLFSVSYLSRIKKILSTWMPLHRIWAACLNAIIEVFADLSEVNNRFMGLIGSFLAPVISS
jgi:hypothetical protein